MENKNVNKKTIKEKFYIFLTIFGMLSMLYFTATNLRNEELENIKFIKKDFKTTRGIITEKHTYKGNSIHVKYNVNGKFYEEIDGFEKKYIINEGDSITLIYSVTKPNLMITEYNGEY